SFVVIDGRPEPYLWLDQFWGSHGAPRDKTMRLVHGSADEKLFAILGSDTGWLDGMASYTKADWGPDSTDGAMELRGTSVRLEPRQTFVCNAFVALAEGPEAWKPWASASPVPLFHRVEDNASPWRPSDLVPLLDHWALPDEHAAGLMILSPLDKLPFSTAQRYSACRCFSGFRGRKGRATASVWAYALRDLQDLDLSCSGTAGWSVSGLSRSLARHALAELTLGGPADLAGMQDVRVRVAAAGRETVLLTIAPDATVTPVYRYQLRQPSAYFDERSRADRACFRGESPRDFKAWQARRRRRFHDWARTAITRPVPLEARVTERQEGPTCIREKIVMRTEPEMWIPLYFVRPRRLIGAGPLPVVLFLCGSGPGKSDMVPDETEPMQDPGRDEQWPSPYAIANRMGCMLACPDHRGWGEWSEANHNQQPGRCRAGGFNIVAMDVWDHLRVVDYLCSRPDVDERYVFSMGSSGGGYMTRFLVGGHEQVAGGIISSSPTVTDALPEHFFFRPEPKTMPAIHPPAHYPMADAAIVQLAAPRPVWIMDGLWDRCALPALPVTDSERQAIFEKWHKDGNVGREAIREVYRLLGVEERFRASWFDGDHLAGFHYRNIREWLLHYWPLAFKQKLQI
ncbi:MAG: prolyl oligopeptidase family serine peptidase, partial [Chloroflexi bacterium]|nr:prolyl oligopeptidase family serine peptidase [Chloroflexota bacterium]